MRTARLISSAFFSALSGDADNKVGKHRVFLCVEW